MKEIVIKEKRKSFDWLNWLSHKWINYEAFVDFDYGSNPKEVAERFIDANRLEFIEFFDSIDKEDLDAINQFQKLTESEAHVLKIIRDQMNFKNKVRYVDFTKSKENK